MNSNPEATDMTITAAEQLECASRELAMRRGAYPKWVAAGRMTEETADKEIAAMGAIVTTLARLRDEEQGQGRLFD